MLSKRAQIVIGIAVVMISAAFLLVGIYFAQLQGLIFQNGADSLQLFANNIAAAKNSLYLAPSSMNIQISGNNSLCTWNSAIDAYDCSGGSKIYNLSYASGPTLDTGTTTYSIALCFILTVGPPSNKGAEVDDAVQSVEALQAANSDLEDEYAEISEQLAANSRLPEVSVGFLPEGIREAVISGLSEDDQAAYQAAEENIALLAKQQAIDNEIAENSEQLDKLMAQYGSSLVFRGVVEPTTYTQTVLSYLGRVSDQISKINAFFTGTLLRNLLTNIGVPALLFFFGAYGNQIDAYISSGFNVAGNDIGSLSAKAQASASSAAAAFTTGASNIAYDTQAAVDLQLQEYSQLASAASALNVGPTLDPSTYNDVQTLVGNAEVQKDELNELADYQVSPPSISGFSGIEVANVALNSTSVSLEVTNLLLTAATINSITIGSSVLASNCDSSQLNSGATELCNVSLSTSGSSYSLSVSIGYTSGAQKLSSSGTVSGNVESGDIEFVAQTTSGLYSTPSPGVSTPSTLSSSDEFVGGASFSSPNDPILSNVGFLAAKSFLVYAQTASCLGQMPQGISINNVLDDALDLIGQATSLISFNTIINTVTDVGTYFVGYGSEVYVNGQANGLPVLAATPVISDLSDLCAITTTTPDVGGSLRTLIFPAGNGDLSFSLTQGLYNTMCSSANPLFPKTLSNFVNSIISPYSYTADNIPSSSEFQVSMMIPPQYAVAFSNSSSDSTICLYRLFLDGNGNPVSTETVIGSQSYPIELGLRDICINLTNMTNGAENLIFSQATFGRNNVPFFVNDLSQAAFSIPLAAYDYPIPSTSGGITGYVQSVENFIEGPGTADKVTFGVDSPALDLVTDVLPKGWQSAAANVLNGLKVSVGNNLESSLLSTSSGGQLSFYPTTYANLTFTVQETHDNGVTNFSIVSATDTLVFGVAPNTYNSLEGSYEANPLNPDELGGLG